MRDKKKKNKKNNFSSIAGDDIEIIDDEELLSGLLNDEEVDDSDVEEEYEESELELDDDQADSDQGDDLDYDEIDDLDDDLPDEEDDKIIEGDELIEKHRKKKRRRRIILIVLLVLIALYGAVSVYFRFHFFPNTKVNGVGFSLSSAEQVQAHMKEDCYILPKYTKDSPEVAEACEKMNSELGANITLDFSPNTEVVDSSVISQWITVDDNMQVTFNQDAVKQYIADLAAKYDTVGKTRNFTTATGNVVQVEGGGYGWKIDQDAEYNALITNIQNAETVTREPNYSSRAATHDANDWGTTYAEVDLTAQHMYFIQNGQIAMQCDIVTGNPNKGNATPQGMYSLYYKQKNQVLRGKKLEDGTYEYESPVDYWMPFNGGIGFHDASWQSAFGGVRYQTYGSHGCVNMPPASAGELYNLIQAGTPIICHY